MRTQDGSGDVQEIVLGVTIKNKNDNIPTVEKTSFTGFIEENSPGGSQVVTSKAQPLIISAQDGDIVNSQLKYQIINSALVRYFSIGEHTGEIRTTEVMLIILQICNDNAMHILYIVKVTENIGLLLVRKYI